MLRSAVLILLLLSSTIVQAKAEVLDLNDPQSIKEIEGTTVVLFLVTGYYDKKETTTYSLNEKTSKYLWTQICNLPCAVRIQKDTTFGVASSFGKMQNEIIVTNSGQTQSFVLDLKRDRFGEVEKAVNLVQIVGSLLGIYFLHLMGLPPEVEVGMVVIAAVTIIMTNSDH